MNTSCHWKSYRSIRPTIRKLLRNPGKVGSLKRHQRLGGAVSAPPRISPFGFFFDFFFDTILETYINEEPMQRIGSLAFKFWMWWPPKDWYPRSDFRISQILVKSIKEIWRSSARNDPPNFNRVSD